MIHPLADCQSSKIGENTSVWQYAVILSGAKLGSNCNINCHSFIENDVIIGDNVTVKSGVYIWDGLRIGDNVFIGPSVTFTNDLMPRSKQRVEFVRTTLEEGCSLGANSSILAGVTIGKFSMVGMASVVVKDVPAYAIVYGNPAKIMGWIDFKGNRLKPVDNERWLSVEGDSFIVENNVLRKV
tara:strand:+ start:8182 stop:8730 length:549 start_codon:yes stop_codon:yes gene_type:complete